MRRSAATAPECGTSLNALLLIGSIRWLNPLLLKFSLRMVSKGYRSRCQQGRINGPHRHVKEKAASWKVELSIIPDSRPVILTTDRESDIGPGAGGLGP